jgi:hypothetical protein
MVRIKNVSSRLALGAASAFLFLKMNLGEGTDSTNPAKAVKRLVVNEV